MDAEGADVAARMAQVLGGPPRLEPLEEDALGEREREVIDRLRDITRHPRGGPVHPFFSTLAHQPEFFEAYMQLGMNAMSTASLGQRARELLILRTGWLCGAPYQFGEHVVIAKRIGLSSEEIERVKLGSAAPGWCEHERSLLKAAEELHADAMISDETWAVLSRTLGPGELIELTMIVGHYHSTAFIQNSLRLRLNEYNRGLAST